MYFEHCCLKEDASTDYYLDVGARTMYTGIENLGIPRASRYCGQLDPVPHLTAEVGLISWHESPIKRSSDLTELWFVASCKLGNPTCVFWGAQISNLQYYG